MRQLFKALSQTSDGAFIIDEQQQIIFWNHSAQTILGYTPNEATGYQCYEILGGRDGQGNTLCQRFCQLAINALHGHSLPNMDLYALTRQGERRWINVTTFALPTGDQGLGYVIVHLFRDATQKKSNELFVKEILTALSEFRNGNKRPELDPIPSNLPYDPGLDKLTPRERQVLLLLAQGLGTDDLASRLHISQATTRNHIQSIMSKLKVHSRLEAVAFAYQKGLMEIDNQ